MLAEVWKAVCAGLSLNHIAIGTVLLVVTLSFLLPNISNKIQAYSEIDELKKVVKEMASQVKKAESHFQTSAQDICCLNFLLQNANCANCADDAMENAKKHQCSNDMLSLSQSKPLVPEKKIGVFRRLFTPKHKHCKLNKEVALMSYFYSDSFLANEKTAEE